MCSLIKRIQAQSKIVKPFMFVSVIAVVFLVSIFVSNFQKDHSFDNELTIIVNDDLRLKSDISSTPHERSIGLSKYNTLMPEESMLFVFNEKGLYSFWMRNMKFPIDIIWLDENKKIVSIKHNADPIDYPQTYSPEKDSLYVLETVAGFTGKNNILIGDQLMW